MVTVNDIAAQELVNAQVMMVLQLQHQLNQTVRQIMNEFTASLLTRLKNGPRVIPSDAVDGFSHTPGPWRVGAGSYVISDNPAPGIGGSDDLDGYGGHLICESVNAPNARLIAAAPRLLSVLKRVASGEDRDGPTLWPEVAAVIYAAEYGV
jgi:hypothetical protein